ncbi:MAG: radical SAM protein [Patescibacteria group bacterium]|nr:radical SAM protein [Patescibacteria group bacterium]
MLNSNCFLVEGAINGALYDLESGHVYSIDNLSTQVLHQCEKKISLKQIEADHLDSKLSIVDYLRSFEKLGVGRFLIDGEYVDKMKLIPPKRKIDLIWLELVHDCNQQCLHCFGSCPLRKSANQQYAASLSLEKWKGIISEAYSLGARRIQFTGGEPMLFGKNIFLLIMEAKAIGYEQIEMFTNATLFDDEDIKLLSQYNVRVATNIYSDQPSIHDKITGLKGSFYKTVTNIKKLQESGVCVSLATILMKQNESCIRDTVMFTEKLGETESLKHFDLVRPVGRGKKNSVLSDNLVNWSLKKKPMFSKITMENFIRRKYGHSCWWGNIAITNDGLVLPCIMAREEVCGDLKVSSLHEIFDRDELVGLWKLSKDQIETCCDCEYRYACMDCRPLAKGESGNFLGKRLSCLYDPYRGVWQEHQPKTGELL